MSKKRFLAVLVCAVLGIGLIAVFSHWAVALGTFLVLTAHQIEKHPTISKRDMRKLGESLAEYL